MCLYPRKITLGCVTACTQTSSDLLSLKLRLEGPVNARSCSNIGCVVSIFDRYIIFTNLDSSSATKTTFFVLLDEAYFLLAGKLVQFRKHV